MASVAIILNNTEIAANLRNETTVWKLDSANEEMRLKIEREIKIITAFCLINISIILYGGFSYIEEDPTDWKVFFAIKLYHDYFPNHPYIPLIYRFTFPVLAYASVIPAYQLIYYTQSLKYQCIMFLFYVNNLTDCNTTKEELKLYNDNEFQREIRLRLSFLVKRHLELME